MNSLVYTCASGSRRSGSYRRLRIIIRFETRLETRGSTARGVRYLRESARSLVFESNSADGDQLLFSTSSFDRCLCWNFRNFDHSSVVSCNGLVKRRVSLKMMRSIERDLS